MSEEERDDLEETPEVEEEQHEERQEAPVEEEARAKGWKPKEEFEADPKNEGKQWVPADEFMRRGELFDEIHSLKKKLGDYDKRMGQITELLTKERQRGYEQRQKELEQAHAKAVEEGDTQGARDAAQQMTQLESEKTREANQAKPEAEEAQRLEREFIAENPWFNTNRRARNYAIAVEQELIGEGVQDPAERLRMAAEETRKAFNLDASKRAPKTEPEGGRTGRRSAKPKMSDLPEDQRQALQEFNRSLPKEHQLSVEDWVKSNQEAFGENWK